MWALVALLPLLPLSPDMHLTMLIMADSHAFGIKGDHNWPQGNLVGKDYIMKPKGIMSASICFAQRYLIFA